MAPQQSVSLPDEQGASKLAAMLTGKIRSLNADKGFGFIKPSAGGADLFFHCSAVDAEFSELQLEQSVEYETDSSAQKPRASKVLTGTKNPRSAKPRSAKPRAEKPYAAKSQASTREFNRSTTKPRYARPEVEYSFGYVTKLPRKNPIGFISAVDGGYEYYFEPGDVSGGTKFARLVVGDYVRFVPVSNAEDPKQPLAKSVMVVPKPINKQENNLARHPKARRKKPTWK